MGPVDPEAFDPGGTFRAQVAASLADDPMPTFRVLAGRLPDASDPTSVMVNESFVKQFRLGAGDRLTVKTFAPRDLRQVQANHYDSPHGPSFPFRITAVVRTPDDVVLDRVTSLDVASSYGASSGMFVPRNSSCSASPPG